MIIERIMSPFVHMRHAVEVIHEPFEVLAGPLTVVEDCLLNECSSLFSYILCSLNSLLW